MSNLRELQVQIAREILEERNREIAEFDAAQQVEQKAAQKRLSAALKELSAAGLAVETFDAIDRRLSAEAEKENQAVQAALDKASEQEGVDLEPLELDRVALPDGVRRLTPTWSSAFTTGKTSKLTGAPTSVARLVQPAKLILGGGCKDWYNWAQGGGSGLFGTGVGEIQSWVEFGFWFKPWKSGFFNIRPRFRFRGYYIVRADDGFFTSKYARTRLTCWTRVHQYNWKPWDSETVLSVGGSNINVNKRFDADRTTYNTALLAAGDWAYVRCVIGLYAYARGGGSFVRNDFATGSANYLCVPSVYVD